MITRTVGVGGDYANWKAANDAIIAAMPLADDYTFVQVSDTTDNTAFSGVNLIYNGHTIRLTSNKYYRGAIGDAWVSNLGDAVTSRWTTDGTPANLIIDGIVFNRTGNTTPVYILLIGRGGIAAPAASPITVIRNCLFVGSGNGAAARTTSFDIMRSSDTIYMSNCKIINCYKGINFEINSGGGDTQTQPKMFENITIYNCRYGVYRNTPFDVVATWKNIVSCNSVMLDWYAAAVIANHTVEHCADSDATLIWGTNNKNGIVPADEFESLVSTNEKFLFLKDGELAANPTASPNRGQAPLSVWFAANAQFQVPDGGVLYNGGTTPELSSTDITGLEYGKYGLYPIGCHNVRVIR